MNQNQNEAKRMQCEIATDLWDWVDRYCGARNIKPADWLRDAILTRILDQCVTYGVVPPAAIGVATVSAVRDSRVATMKTQSRYSGWQVT